MGERDHVLEILEGADPAGRIFAGYELVKMLGRGATALVLEAKPLDDPLVRIALKIQRPDASPTLRERFRREGRLARKAKHPNVVDMLSTGDVDGLPFYALELVLGADLDALVRQRGLPPVRWVVSTFVAIASAIAALHRKGIIHRDLKPANIMIEESSGRPAIMDLGIAKCVDGLAESWDGSMESQGARTAEGQILGTPAYMAPEQVEGGDNGQTVGKAVDIYGFGATLSFALTGQPPFRGVDLLGLFEAVVHAPPPAPRRLRPEVPPALDELVLSCLAKAAKDRPWSAAELMCTLEAIAKELKQDEPLGAWGEPWRLPEPEQPPEGEGPRATSASGVLTIPSGATDRFGPFQLLERIAEDFTGEYYSARQLPARRLVVVKRASASRTKLLEQFRREAQLLAGFNHPTLPRVIGAGDVSGVPYVTLEPPAGAALPRLLKERGRLKIDRVLRIAEGLTNALAITESAGLMPLDLRPELVWVDAQGECRLLGACSINERDTDVRPWGPPERRSVGADPCRQDVWMLGALLHELVMSDAPEASEAPPFVVAAIERAMSPAPELRQANAAELGHDLRSRRGGSMSARFIKRLFGKE